MTYTLETDLLPSGEVQVTIATPSTVTKLEDVDAATLREWADTLMRAADHASTRWLYS